MSERRRRWHSSIGIQATTRWFIGNMRTALETAMSDIPDLLLAPLLVKVREKLLQLHPATDDEYSDFTDKIRADMSISFLSGLCSVAAAHPDSPVLKNKKQETRAKLFAPVLSLVRDKLQELRPSDHAAYLKFTEQIKLNARIKLAFAVSGLAQSSSDPSTEALSSLAISNASSPANELDRIRSECIRAKKPYTDPDFPPQLSSLLPAEGGTRALEWKDLVWQRASSLQLLNKAGQMRVFQGAIEPADIKQGALGNCYFLSALSVLAEYPQRIRDLFVSDLVTPECVYGIKMYMNGSQQTIFVDDFVPCKRNEPFFSHAHGEEIWVILLEKAWAKSHGNYDRIIGGTSSNTMRDLTGAPAYSLKTNQAGLWETILASDRATHCMAAGTGETQSDEGGQCQEDRFKSLGLILGHAYGLISAATVQDKHGRSVNLVKLRNPWGGTEWKGAWSDHSDCWTPQLKQALQFVDEDDGTFWMDFEDFKHYFGRLYLCKTVVGHVFSHVPVQQPPESFTLLRAHVPLDGQYTFSVSQKSHRCFPKGHGYKYGSSRMIVAKLNGRSLSDGLTYIKGGKGFLDRDAYIECDSLQAGNYYFFIEMDWSDHRPDDCFSATCYGPGQVQFSEERAGITKSEWLHQALLSKFEQGRADVTSSDQSENHAPLITRHICLVPDDGYMFVYHHLPATSRMNESRDILPHVFVGPQRRSGGQVHGKWRVSCLQKLGSMRAFLWLRWVKNIAKPHRLQHVNLFSEYVLEVGPGETKIVVVRAAVGGYNISMSYSTQVSVGDSALRELCLKEGDQKERAPDIVQYFYWHSSGAMVIYTNKTKSRTLNETLTLNLEGLRIEGQDDQSKVKLRVGPGQEAVIKLAKTGGNCSFSSSASFSLEKSED